MPELTGELKTWAGKLVALLEATRKKARLLPPTHTYVAESVRELQEVLQGLFEELPSVTVSLVGGEIFVEGNLLAEESLTRGELIAEFADRRLASITFEKNVRFEDLATFIGLSNLNPQEVEERGAWDQILTDQKLQGIRLGPLPITADGVGGVGSQGSDGADDGDVLNEVYRSCLDVVLTAFNRAHGAEPLAIELLEDQVKLLVAGVMENEAVFRGLATLKSLDEYTFYHSINVTILSLLMGSKLRLDARTLHQVGLAAILHDVGKTLVPDEILNKPGSLSKEEWEVMQAHSVNGARILTQQREVGPLPPVIAAQHHARHDLGGYPKADRPDKLHLLSEVVAVADVYDALTSDRSYRKAMLPDRALRLVLEGRGTHFHPTVVKVFAQVSGLFPVGTLVELDTGEMGVVVQANGQDLTRPRVKLAKGTGAKPETLPVVDLTAPGSDGGFRRTILRSLDPADHGITCSDYFDHHS